MEELNEPLLNDDYPVYWDYLYVCDGQVVRSDIRGTVRDLKYDRWRVTGIKVKEVRRCDMEGRLALLNQQENK